MTCCSTRGWFVAKASHHISSRTPTKPVCSEDLADDKQFHIYVASMLSFWPSCCSLCHSLQHKARKNNKKKQPFVFEGSSRVPRIRELDAVAAAVTVPLTSLLHNGHYTSNEWLVSDIWLWLLAIQSQLWEITVLLAPDPRAQFRVSDKPKRNTGFQLRDLGRWTQQKRYFIKRHSSLTLNRSLLSTKERVGIERSSRFCQALFLVWLAFRIEGRDWMRTRLSQTGFWLLLVEREDARLTGG